MGSTESTQSPFATHCVEFKNAREKVSMIIIRHRDSDVTNAGLFGIAPYLGLKMMTRKLR